MSDSKQSQSQPQEHQTQSGGEPLKGGSGVTGDAPSKQAKELQEQVEVQSPAANVNDPDYNPTTPDGKAPSNNLPGPHGPQGQEGQLVDPATGKLNKA